MNSENLSPEQEFLLNQAAQQNQGQPEVDPNSLYVDYMQEEKTKTILQQLDPENLMEEIEYRLRGYRRNRFTKNWEKNPHCKKINEELISNFVGFLSPILTQNVSISNFSEKEISAIMEDLIDYIISDLNDNEKLYHIEGDDREKDRILRILLIPVFSTFKQALNGMFARRIFSSLRVSENLTQQKKPGILDSLKFWN